MKTVEGHTGYRARNGNNNRVAVDDLLQFDLGKHSLSVTTTSPMAQRLFDQGLNWCFGFNQEEGLACFEMALKSDPTCAMAHWGAAYAAGPFYNMPWCEFSDVEAIECTAICRGHIEKALVLSDKSTKLEVALIAALAERIQKPHVVSQLEFDSWDEAYANAMRSVNKAFPNNIDVMALFIEAMMTRTPWKLWDVKPNLPPPNTDTFEALAVCEQAIAFIDSQGLTASPAFYASNMKTRKLRVRMPFTPTENIWIMLGPIIIIQRRDATIYTL